LKKMPQLGYFDRMCPPWLSGVFDAEGSVLLYRTAGSVTFRLSLAQGSNGPFLDDMVRRYKGAGK